MFEDFLNLNYWKTNNKLAKIRELINRIGKETLDTGFIFGEIESITNRLNRLDLPIQNLGGWINPERKSPSEPGGGESEEEEGEEVLLPDLIVDEIKSVEKDHYIDFEITVKNQGKKVSESCTLNVNIPSSEESNVDLNVPSLEIGATTAFHHQYSFDKNSPLPKENKTILTTADSTYIIEESNETNNTRSAQFEVLPQKAGLIVHIHNPEGKEIGSITGILRTLGPTCYIYPENNPSYTIPVPIDESTHGVPYILSPGNYVIGGDCNGVQIKTTQITIESNKCYEIFFTFPRTEHKLDFNMSESLYSNGHKIGIPWEITVKSGGSAIYNINQTNFSAHLTQTATIWSTGWHGSPPPPIHLYSTQIPSHQSFLYWYCQSNTVDCFPGIRAIHSMGSCYIMLQSKPGNDGYKLRCIRAEYLYTDLRFFYFYFNGAIGTSTSTVNLSGTLDFKMSSIPYDIQGTAV